MISCTTVCNSCDLPKGNVHYISHAARAGSFYGSAVLLKETESRRRIQVHRPVLVNNKSNLRLRCVFLNFELHCTVVQVSTSSTQLIYVYL